MSRASKAFKMAYQYARKTRMIQPSCLAALLEAFPEASQIHVKHKNTVHGETWEARVNLNDKTYVQTAPTAIEASESLVELYG